MLIIIIVCRVVCINSFVLPETYNLLIKDSLDYKVDLVINDDDYEMIDRAKLEELKIDDIQVIELDKMASMDYKNKTGYVTAVNLYSGAPESTTLPIMVVSINNVVTTTYIARLTTHANKKREIVNENEVEYEYNYNDLINEYYEQTNNETVVNIPETQDYGVMYSFKRIFLAQTDKNNCNKSIGLQAIQCLLEDYNTQRRPTKDIVSRLWRIGQIWFLVYLVVAVPLWCTRGWCCCCLCCKFFNPRRTIDEAKRYLILYPPGVFKTKHGEIHYEPTEREKEAYEEFEHFVKTL